MPPQVLFKLKNKSRLTQIKANFYRDASGLSFEKIIRSGRGGDAEELEEKQGGDGE